jgi:hypothetical protein
VYNSKVFSTNYQELLLTAIDVDLQETGRLLAKGTPILYDNKDFKIAQSRVGNRVEIIGDNFG